MTVNITGHVCGIAVYRQTDGLANEMTMWICVCI